MLTLCPVTPPVTDAHCPGVTHSWFSQDTWSPNVPHILTRSRNAQQQDQAKQDPAAQACLLWPHDTVMRANEAHGNWTGPGRCIRARYMGCHEQPTLSSQCKLPADSQLHLNSTDTTKLGSSQHFKWSIQIDVPTRLWPVKYISCVTQILAVSRQQQRFQRAQGPLSLQQLRTMTQLPNLGRQLSRKLRRTRLFHHLRFPLENALWATT